MTSAWLADQGVTPQLAASYKKSGWLSPLGRGAWIRAGSDVDWMSAVFALQEQQGLHVYPHGRTALEIVGMGHYIPLGKFPPVQLSLPAGERLPSWFLRQPFAVNLRVFNSSTLFDPYYTSLLVWQEKAYSIRISSAERAIVELCHLVPGQTDTEEVKFLMQSLTSLRSQVLQKVLLECQSVKAKRLFLALAEIVGYPWYEKLDISLLDLGHGNRVLPIEGRIHPRFRITVPEIWTEE